jgi:hypothetical protein
MFGEYNISLRNSDMSVISNVSLTYSCSYDTYLCVYICAVVENATLLLQPKNIIVITG